jgi:CDGSH-type Zn-finger protein
MTSRSRPPEVEVCPGGPILLRGEAVVVADTGAEPRTHRPVSAVCACGYTATKPSCDGTHKLVVARTGRSGPSGPDT